MNADPRACWSLRYDLRSPEWAGVTMRARYAAALEQAAWADEHGASEIVLSEHHGSEDGYLPSPLVFAGAVAACTKRLRIVIAALILPLHDPVRAAEDLVVLDVASGGRAEVVVGLGYVPSEFAMFGLDSKRRGALLDEKLAVFSQALTGRPFEYRGTTIQVTPAPVQKPRPPLLVGGGVAASALRAARFADGFMPMMRDESLYATYEAECERLGKPPGKMVRPSGALFTHVSEDPDRDWARIAPHALYEMNSYGRWAAEGRASTGFKPVEDAEELRESGLYRVVTPAQCLETLKRKTPASPLMMHPLMGGIPPALAWESLELFAAKVLPHVT